MPCFNLKQILSNKHFYAHLLDVQGSALNRSSLNSLTMALILVSTFAMTKAENSLILPVFQRYAHLTGMTADAINSRLRTFFAEVCQSFSLFFDKSEVFAGLMKKLEDGLNLEEEFLIYEAAADNDFNGEPVCKDCQLSANVQSDCNIQKLLDNQYSSCQMTLNLNCEEIVQSGSIMLQERLEQVANDFSNLKSLQLIRPSILGDTFFANFNKLLKLEINEDQLEILPAMIFRLPVLKMLTLSNSSIK